MSNHNHQQLSHLLQGIIPVSLPQELSIAGLSLDSREVQKGDLFFACMGTEKDGRQFIDEAIGRGAAAVICESQNDTPTVLSYEINNKKVPLLAVQNLQQQIGKVAARFYGDPSQSMRIIGITGTNGKTSCCQYIANVLEMAGENTGVIGTLGSGLYGDLHPNSYSHTTPNPIELQQLLMMMKNKGAKTVVMEVSSHSLQQHRIEGIHFDIGVFTNLTREHLDYHGDMETYANAKRSLFTQPDLRYGVINIDDKVGQQLINTLHGQLSLFAYSGLGRHSSTTVPLLSAHQVNLDMQGITASVHTPWGDGVVHSSLIGRFNLNNLLAVLAILRILEIPLEDALGYLTKISGIPGRMEALGGDSQPWVIIDYAHSPDALQHVLNTVREFCDGELWCLFGCGGNRDKGKRPLMGQIAENSADHVIITDDNPRTEDPREIVKEILNGMAQPERVVVEHDRYRAIEHALNCAKIGDVVLIAGKGHEDYQIVGKEKRLFNDKLTVQMLFTEL